MRLFAAQNAQKSGQQIDFGRKELHILPKEYNRKSESQL